MAKNVPTDILDWILGLAEGEDVDFKRLRGKCVQGVVKTIAAMANGDGGLIVLGVQDAKKGSGRDRLYGVAENREALGDIKRALVANVEPPLAQPNCTAPTFHPVPCLLRDRDIVNSCG